MARIAIVDGSGDARGAFRDALGSRGHEVATYASLELSRETLFDCPPDLLILDAALPDGSGLELSALLRTQHSPDKLPILFVSSVGQESDYLRGYAAGATDYLVKPVREEELVAKCARLLAATVPDSDAVTVPPRAHLSAGSTFAGRYLLEGKLGVGGYGAVFSAFDLERDGAPVALKILLDPIGSQPECRWRFLREIYALSAVRHPAVVRVFDNGEAQGHIYLAMERVEGPTLTQFVRRRGRPLNDGEVQTLLRGLTGALESLARADLLHRDVKPSNVILRGGRLDSPVLVDFGLARRPFDHSLTAADMVVGTLGYMAPENLLDEELDLRSDLYSLAMVAFFACTGEEPFARLRNMELMRAVTSRRVEFPPHLSPPLRELLMELASVSRAGRPASAAAVMRRLQSTARARTTPTSALKVQPS